MKTILKTIVISAGLFVPLAILSAVAPATAGSALIAAPTDLSVASGNNCFYGEIIDGSTAEQARKKFQAAGYSDVHVLHKGCDNFWHANGIIDGQRSNMVLAPDGTVLPEGD